MKHLRTYALDIALMTLLFVCAIIPRTIEVGTFLTADEKTWIGRSYEFIRAFKDVRLNDMLQTTHPGVTTLWAVGITETLKMVLSDVPFTNDTLFHFIKSSQFVLGFLNAAAIPGIYILVWWVLKKRSVAFFAALLLALNPLLIGYSRVIHVDALLGSFLTLAVLASILYARSLTLPWLIASAVLSALALLTKFPAVVLFPFIISSLAVFYGKQIVNPAFLKERSKDALTWLLIVALIIFIMWPALLWVPNPLGNVLQVKKDISIAASTPHNMTEDYSLNAYHYPAALLSRSTPLSLTGAILGLVAITVLIYRKRIPREMSLIALYLLGFVVMMTLGAKKGDRYILPVFFALDILAAYGILWACSFVHNLKNRRLVIVSACLLSTSYLLSVVISYHPYAIAYSNPMFPDNISQELGWGEGLDQVAAWLNTNHPNAIVASWYPGELAPFTSARILHINAHEQNQVQFIVLYKNMFGREPSHYANDFIDEYYKKRDPVFIAHVAGKEYAWVYEKPSYAKTVGDLDGKMLVVQEVVAEYDNLAGVDILAATRFGEVRTGVLEVTFSRSLLGVPFFTSSIHVTDLQDAAWNTIDIPREMNITKGEHIFIGMRVQGANTPYASIRYAPEAVRRTPLYISRTGTFAEATAKPGSVAIRLRYIGTDGALRSELETKLLR